MGAEQTSRHLYYLVHVGRHPYCTCKHAGSRSRLYGGAHAYARCDGGKLHASFICSERLSFDKLEQSWNELVTAWPILAARIRKSKTSPSGLEYHIPSPRRLRQIQRQAPSREPTSRQFYCLDVSPRPISSYFAALQPRSDARSGVFVAASPKKDEERQFSCANATRTFDEYLQGDCPLVTIQVTRFAYDTMVSLAVSHVIGDGFVISNIMKKWQDILHGRGAPAPLRGLGMDPLLPFAPQNLSGAEKPPRLPMGWHTFHLREKVRFIANFAYDLYIARPEKKLQQRYIFLPRSFVEELQGQARLDLERKAASEGVKASTVTSVGKSNILYAWLMKNSHAGLPHTWNSTPLTIVNSRNRLPNGHGPVPPHDFWGAAFSVPIDSLTVGTITSMSLGELALHVRDSIVKQSETENVQTSLTFTLSTSLWKDKDKKDRPMHFFSPSDHRWSGISDWRALKLFDLDFGPAVLDQKQDKRAPVMTLGANMFCAMSKRDRWVCIGESDQGTWFTGFMSPEQWSHPSGFGRFPYLLSTDPNQRGSKL